MQREPILAFPYQKALREGFTILHRKYLTIFGTIITPPPCNVQNSNWMPPAYYCCVSFVIIVTRSEFQGRSVASNKFTGHPAGWHKYICSVGGMIPTEENRSIRRKICATAIFFHHKTIRTALTIPNITSATTCLARRVPNVEFCLYSILFNKMRL
jgi:hypothetical protein